jgi:hypothetical protein
MKRIVILLCTVGLFGCSTVPVTQSFPKTNDALMKPVPELKEIPYGSSASEIFDVVIENYGTYHEVANQLESWQKWYKEQKQIFESVNKEK